jgi:TatD DNase family protein
VIDVSDVQVAASLTGSGFSVHQAQATVRPMLYDTHAHLDYPDYAAEVAAMIDRAHAADITRIIAIGTNLESSRRAIALAEQFDAVYAAPGWHPGEAMQAPADIRADLRELSRHPKVVALGETGLDYFRLSRDAAASEPVKRRQADLFDQHLEVAAETGLNVVIHQRAALQDTLRLLEPWSKRVRGVFHCFAETAAVRQQIADLGSIVSYTGIVTFKNGQNIRETLAATPLGEFMLETDSPYLTPEPHRGKRNEPAFVRDIAAMVAELKGCSIEELGRATCAAAHDFFHKLR